MEKQCTYIARNKWADQGDQGPEEDTTGHDQFSVVSISQISEDGWQDHVTADEGSLQKSSLRIVDPVASLNVQQHTWNEKWNKRLLSKEANPAEHAWNQKRKEEKLIRRHAQWSDTFSLA